MITIGIPAYREEKTIVRAIKRIFEQGIKDLEVIVVCPDVATAVAVKGMKDKRIRLIKEKRRRGKPSAVNEILKRARGEIIVLTDADLLIEKSAVKKLVEPFKDQKVGAVCGRPVVTNKRSSMFGFWGHFLYDTAHKRRMKNPRHITTNLCAVRKGIVSRIPNEALIDDYVIGMSVLEKGCKIAYVPAARVFVNFPTSLKDFLIQRKRTFAGYMQVEEWYGKMARTFASEVKEGMLAGMRYCKNFKEYFYFGALCFWRMVAWLIAFYEYKIKKRKLIQIWGQAKSTK